MKVDVIIPSYKRERLTLEAVNSVLQQSYTGFNLFVIEDGSQLLKNSLPSDPRLQYINTGRRKGPAATRNTGAAAGKAPLIAFLDSDDLWRRDKLKKQLAYLNENPEVQYAHTNEEWLRDKIPVKQKGRHRKQGGFFLERLFERCLISPSAVIFRRDFYRKTGGFAPAFQMAEDYEYWLRINLHHAAGFIDEPLTIKRAGQWQQLSATVRIDHYRLLALHRFYRFFKNDPAFSMNTQLVESWAQSALKKASYLIQGSEKHNRPDRAARYRAFEKVFLRLRTALIREA